MNEQAPSKDQVSYLLAKLCWHTCTCQNATSPSVQHGVYCVYEQARASMPAHEPKARDADLYEWVSGLVEALNLAGITRAKGDEHIDTDYLAELHARLAQPPPDVPLGRGDKVRIGPNIRGEYSGVMTITHVMYTLNHGAATVPDDAVVRATSTKGEAP